MYISVIKWNKCRFLILIIDLSPIICKLVLKFKLQSYKSFLSVLNNSWRIKYKLARDISTRQIVEVFRSRMSVDSSPCCSSSSSTLTVCIGVDCCNVMIALDREPNINRLIEHFLHIFVYIRSADFMWKERKGRRAKRRKEVNYVNSNHHIYANLSLLLLLSLVLIELNSMKQNTHKDRNINSKIDCNSPALTESHPRF
mgnify:CR=1 FL=1